MYLPSIVEFELDRLRILACSGNPFLMLRRGSIQQGEKKDEGLEGGGGVPASRKRGSPRGRGEERKKRRGSRRLVVAVGRCWPAQLRWRGGGSVVAAMEEGVSREREQRREGGN